jgi:hypothetical protein
MLNHLIMLADGRRRVLDWCRRCAPWFTSEAESLVDRLITSPLRYTADHLAHLLNLTNAERKHLKIRTIGAVDFDKKQRASLRREEDRLAKEAKRRAAGAKPRAQSLSRTKPWLELGISRSKWYADRRAAHDPETSENFGQFRRQYKEDSTVDDFVQPCEPSGSDEARRRGPIASSQTISRLDSPLSLSACLEMAERTPSRAATTPDWRQRSADSWAEIMRLRAQIIASHQRPTH